MNREIQIDEDMKAAITRVNGGQPIDFNSIAVFEARSLNTRPLRRKSGIYAHAVTSKSTLESMTALLNNSVEGVPLHVMHNTDMLNIGKVFRARLDQSADGAWELSSQFYIPREFKDLVARFNTGTTDQVSVGVLAATVNCSECGFDYRKGGIENVLMCECDDGHVIGENGVHTILNGLETWGELSIVDRGAAEDARIVSADRSKFTTRDNIYRLAAAHNQNDLKTYLPLIATLEEISGEEINQVDEAKVQELIAAALAASNKESETKAVADLQAQLDKAVADRDGALEAKAEAEAQVATLTAERDSARTERDEIKAEFGELDTYVKDQAKKAQVAAGSTSPVEPANFKDAVKVIEDSSVNLVNLYARDKTSRTIEGKKEVKPALNLKAFQRQGDK